MGADLNAKHNDVPSTIPLRPTPSQQLRVHSSSPASGRACEAIHSIAAAETTVSLDHYSPNAHADPPPPRRHFDAPATGTAEIAPPTLLRILPPTLRPLSAPCPPFRAHRSRPGITAHAFAETHSSFPRPPPYGFIAAHQSTHPHAHAGPPSPRRHCHCTFLPAPCPRPIAASPPTNPRPPPTLGPRRPFRP
jgi:hypothetical protein